MKYSAPEAPAPPPTPLLNAREVAAWLGLELGVVFKHARNGLLPSIKLPSGSIRFRREDVEKLIQASRRTKSKKP
jgi:predicted site-specific integrase-resolvase